MDAFGSLKDQPACFVGLRLGSTHQCTEQYFEFSTLHEKEKAVVFFVSKDGENIPDNLLICSCHRGLQRRYARRKFCANPFKTHQLRRYKKSEATVEQARKMRANGIEGYPGEALCYSCLAEVNRFQESNEDWLIAAPTAHHSAGSSGSTSSDHDANTESTSGVKVPVPGTSISKPFPTSPPSDNIGLTSENSEVPGTSTMSPKTPPVLASKPSKYYSPDMFAPDMEDETLSTSTCYVGYQVGELCIGQLLSLTPEERDILSNLLHGTVPEEAVICDNHKDKCFRRRVLGQRQCVNPFSHPQHVSRKAYMFADWLQVRKLLEAGFPAVFNDGLCKMCSAEISKLPSPTRPSSSQKESQELGSTPSSGPCSSSSGAPLSGTTSAEVAAIDLADILKAAKLPNIEVRDYHEYGKRKVAEQTYGQVKGKVKRVLCQVFSLNEEALSEEESNTDTTSLVEQLKIKLRAANSFKEKVKLLTLSPASWPHEKVAKEFGVSVHAVKTARQLRNERGILPDMQAKRGRPLSEEVKQLVRNFYTDSEFSRECPGSNQQVSLGKGRYEAKRLLLGNLRELYAAFKDRHPNVKIGRSRFCRLRPKWCIWQGSKGMHVVCVCKYHENFKLLLNALNLSATVGYKDIIKMVVCSVEERKCMMRMCGDCPSPQEVEKTLRKFVLENLHSSDGESSSEMPGEEEEEEEEETIIKFRQWVSTDRPNIETMETTLTEYVSIMTKKIIELIPHSYIATKQADHLRHSKETLPEDKAILLMDFAENYAYKVQDEIQSHHFVKNSCTLHPVVLYYRKEGKMENRTFCFLSEDNRHDVAFVDVVQQKVTAWIKEELPEVKHIEYFTDGCAGQYKNCTSFFNLCSHYERFGLTVTWSFFATSHGKSPCDGVGGAVKRSAAAESLSRIKVSKNPINNIVEMFEFCQKRERENVTSIKHMLISKDETLLARERISNLKAVTVPGTQSFHCVPPLSSKGRIRFKKLSSDENRLSTVYDMQTKLAHADYEEETFVACAIEDSWHVAFISCIRNEESELELSLLARLTDENDLEFKSIDDTKHIVPMGDILTVVEVETFEEKYVLKSNVRDIKKAYRKWSKRPL